ncbi:MAG: hypothetical protein AAF629_16280 [Chloroflexota bacterium]
MIGKGSAIRQVFHSATDILIGRRRLPDRYTELYQPPVTALTAKTIKSGFTQLDKAIGIGGLPQRSLIEIIGPKPGGILSIASKIGAKFQRKQLPVSIIDAVGTVELAHAVRCGLVAPELLLRLPQNALELIHLVQAASKEDGLVIVYLGFIPETFAGVPAENIASLFKRLHWLTNHSESVFLFITLLEHADPFIHTNYVPGFQLNDAANVRIWVQDEGWIRKHDQINGYRGNITVIKNDYAMSGKGANIRIPFVDPEIMRLSDELGF